jgi:hypothetical protein
MTSGSMNTMINRSFIICITVEPAPGGSSPAEWKGLVQDVASGEWGDFMTFKQMTDFIVQKAGLDAGRDDSNES